jgi:hypothetical protein
MAATLQPIFHIFMAFPFGTRPLASPVRHFRASAINLATTSARKAGNLEEYAFCDDSNDSASFAGSCS